MTARDAAKTCARGVATLVVAPMLVSYWIRSAAIGRDRALEGSTQALAIVPGLLGQYLRRAFLSWTLEECAPSATIEFGTLFSQAGARLGENVYVGPRCHLGLAHLERDVLLGAGVHVPSGRHTHGTSEMDVPIRDQQGRRRAVRVGRGTWVGSGAIILENVGCDSVIGAGAVVTKPIPDRVVAAGVPARVVKAREPHLLAKVGGL